ncbi:cytochrome P450 [Kutzneria sp. CA-103260]|uniref:cytochrome P450 n=1 Tax=Kutzneria sp. CA-103260 TaxID=2802641 RepID=UPI001BA7BF4D|nr:cytochrome P450 [Kutzneria sp. CA-103260]
MESSSAEVRPLPLRRAGECPYRPSTAMTELREQSPVAKVLCPTGIEAWLVTGYDQVQEVLRDSHRFSSRSGQFGHVLANQPPDAPMVEGAFHRLDGAEHLRYRRVLAPAITTPRRIEQFRVMVQDIVNDQVDTLAAGPVDLHVAYSRPVASTVLATLIDVPAEEHVLFQQAAETLFDDTVDRKTFLDAMIAVTGSVRALVQARRDEPGEDVVSVLIERAQAGDQPLTETELVNMIVGFVLAGLDTMATTLSYALVLLLERHAEFTALRDDPTLIPGAVEEIVRYLSNGSGTLRVATVDTEIGGVPIAAGEYVIAGAHAANHDPSRFTDPEVLDLRRERNPHIGFGDGAHQCVAQQLARLELIATLDTLTRRIPTLRLAEPFEHIEFKYGTPMGGPVSLPVTWDAIHPRGYGQ